MGETEFSDKPAQPGQSETLAPGVRRILAPNPSPMTFRGTNTYLVGHGSVAVIDPGPANTAHLKAILGSLAPDETITAILVTHSHKDHSPLARELSGATNAPIFGFGDSKSGQTAIMRQLAEAGLTGGGEGVDAAFEPDVLLKDADLVSLGSDTIQAIWTPGHMGNHLCFSWNGSLFCGDIVMGWASTMVSPPDGDLTAFYQSCERLRARPEVTFYPGHGDPIVDPIARIDWLVAHRRSRETQILAALRAAPGNVSDLTQQIYHDIDPALWPAASRNVLAHLIDLHSRGVLAASPELSVDAQFYINDPTKKSEM